MNPAFLLRCFVVGAAVLFGSTVSSQTSALAPTDVNITISQYDPENPKHEVIAGGARIMCGKIHSDRIKAERSTIKSLERLTEVMKEGTAGAGVCAHQIHYLTAVAAVSKIPGMSETIDAFMGSPAYEETRKKFANADTAICSRMRYRVIGEILADPARISVEMPATILDARLFCMSLLGQQSGVTSAMNYYFQSLK